MQTACHVERSETSRTISLSGNAGEPETNLRFFAALRMTKSVCEMNCNFFGVIRRVWRIIKILRLEYGNKVAEFVFDVAGCSNGVGDLLSQYRLIALPKSIERLPDCILGHPQACGDLCL